MTTILIAAALAAGRCSSGDIKTNPGGTALKKIVVGYFASWKKAEFTHTAVRYADLTHIAHAFVWPDDAGNLIVPSDYLYPELNAAAHAAGVKMIMSVGGWGNDGGFAGTVSTAANRTRFIGQAVDFCKAHAYDGVDLDWEFVDTPAEQTGFALLVLELSAALKSQTPPLLLTMAAPAGDYYARWIDFENLAASFDFVGFMTYDFHGTWSDHSGHNSPLYADAGDACGSVRETFDYARGRGVPLAKMLLGVPFYGRSFDCDGLGLPFTTCADYGYAEAMDLLGSGWTRSWDATARVPYLLEPGGGTFLSYDDLQSVGEKCALVNTVGAAGIIIWELSQDFRNGKSELLEEIGKDFREP